MKEIIEDTISRNKEFQKKQLEKIEKMKQFGAPPIILEREEKIAKMTLAEYYVFLEEEKKQWKEIVSDYAKDNPIQKQIVDEIYSRLEKLTYQSLTYSSFVRFLCEIDPKAFMSDDDFTYDLYTDFLLHAHELYREKYHNEQLAKEIKDDY